MRAGLVVNPVAGLGAVSGLNGSDGLDVQRRARERGGLPRAAEAVARVLDTLEALRVPGGAVEFVTVPGAMGADALAGRDRRVSLVAFRPADPTSAEDTRQAVAAIEAAGVDLLLFAGGDGTAGDVVAAHRAGAPVLGIPGGVKMQSAVFATSTRAAAEIVAVLADGRRVPVEEREVVDLDEESRRQGRLASRLHGVLPVPVLPDRVQSRKMGSSDAPGGDAAAAAVAVVRDLEPGVRYILGPGTTTAQICRMLGQHSSLLGADVLEDGRTIGIDLSQRELLELARPGDRVVVSPIGGQGFLLGRGDQQIGGEVVRRVGPEGVLCVASEAKLAALGGRPLLVDTGLAEVDAALAGYTRCVVGVGRSVMYPVRIA